VLVQLQCKPVTASGMDAIDSVHESREPIVKQPCTLSKSLGKSSSTNDNCVKETTMPISMALLLVNYPTTN
jgi:hypothetical protein